MKTRIPLSEVLAHITDEIISADQRAEERGFGVMRFEECELEFAIETEQEASGAIKFWVLELGGGVKRNESNIVRMKYVKTEESFQAE